MYAVPTRAETYGPLKDLEALLDEYYAASGMDRRRLADLRRRIVPLGPLHLPAPGRPPCARDPGARRARLHRLQRLLKQPARRRRL